MFARALFVGFVFCFLIQICGTPRALAGDDGEPGLYVEGGASYYILELPDYTPIQTFNYPAGGPYTFLKPLAVNDDPASGFMGRLTLGVRTAFPFFFEVTGRFFEAKDGSNKTYRGDELEGDYIGFFPVDGLDSANGTTGDAYVDLHTRFSETAGRLLLGYALKLGHGFTLSPFVGGEVMHIDQSYDMDYDTSTAATIRRFDDALDSRYRGAMIGVRLEARLGEYLATITGNVARYQVHTDYNGGMTIGDYSGEFSLRDETWTTGLELSASLDRNWGPFSLGLKASMRQLSYVPQIVPSGRDTILAPDGNLPYITGHESKAYSFELQARYAF